MLPAIRGPSQASPRSLPPQFSRPRGATTTANFLTHHHCTPPNTTAPPSLDKLVHFISSSTPMGWLDRVPGAGNLFIGGLFALRRREAVKEAQITHVVSVLRWPIDQELINPYKHLQIDVDDEDDENLLQYFPATNRFIQDALDNGGSVIVHCAMGKSRSATVVIAYLMHRFRLTVLDALNRLREARPVCEPNSGFMHQLDLYHKMETPADVESNPLYQRWIYQRELQLSRDTGMAPEAEKIRFEDEHAQQSAATFELRCKRCRRSLASSQYLTDHKPREVPENAKSTPMPPSACSHYFLDPLSWMRAELEQGKLDGRLECPKCNANIGKYAWQGMQCSCGDWVVPGISLAKGRIDEATMHGSGSAGAQSMGIRLPPGKGHL